MGNPNKTVLCEQGFGIVWLSGYANNENYVLSEIKSRLIDVFLQNWSTKLSNNEDTFLYFSFKSHFTPKHYLSSKLLNPTLKKYLSRFRCGVSKLNTHRYRYSQNKSHILCPFCPNQIESEIHSIFLCEAYKDLRLLYIPNKFIEKASLQTLAVLLSNESYQLFLGKYLLAMFTRREKLLKERSTSLNN